MNKNVAGVILFVLCMGMFVSPAKAQVPKKSFKVVVLAEPNSVHAPFVAAAKKWLQQKATEHHFTIDYIENADPINDAFLSHYQLFIQLDYPPYRWSDTAKAAFEKYITDGKGKGWIGFHHASLLGEFDGYSIWPWFSAFLGGIRYKNYIADFATATVRIEDRQHPCLKGIPAAFEVSKEEWYTYDKSPRSNVHVLASVDESTYAPDSKIKMGDHPVIWSNDRMKARNIYIFMGHHPDLFKNEAFKTLFQNAIVWAAGGTL